jgi:hypothetical protein
MVEFYAKFCTGGEEDRNQVKKEQSAMEKYITQVAATLGFDKEGFESYLQTYTRITPEISTIVETKQPYPFVRAAKVINGQCAIKAFETKHEAILGESLSGNLKSKLAGGYPKTEFGDPNAEQWFKDRREPFTLSENYKALIDKCYHCLEEIEKKPALDVDSPQAKAEQVLQEECNRALLEIGKEMFANANKEYAAYRNARMQLMQTQGRNLG